ncbi:MAG: DUF507 family protein [Nitrospinota bacterium]
MKLTREKINQLSKVILKALLEDDRVEYFVEENDLRLGIVKVLTEELQREEDIDAAVRKTINSYGRDIREGTNEWDLLYQRHYQEENKKRRGITI